MIKIILLKNNFFNYINNVKNKKKYLDLVLYPNRSLNIKSLIFLASIFTVLSFLISFYFINTGAWPVGIFLFIDLLIILLAFKFNYRNSKKYERIILKDELLIKKINFRGKEKIIKIEPSWLRLKVRSYNNSGHLEIISKGKPQIIGSYLNLTELKKLAKEIKKALILREKELSLNF